MSASSTSTARDPGHTSLRRWRPHFRHRALFIGPNARAAIAEGRADYVPTFLSDVPRLFDSGLLPLDAVSSTRRHPMPRLLLPGDVGRGDARRDPRRPAGHRPVQQRDAATLGDSFIHVSQIDLAIECDVPPYELPVGPIGDVERKDRRVRRRARPRWRHAPAGDRRHPAATALALRDKRDLGVHTEMFTDSIVDLVEAGVITGARKERNRGKLVTAFLMGTKRLYDFVDDNPMVEMRPVDFTNDTHVIRSFSRMVAINSAIEVDLSGQVVADSIGTAVQRVGGQMDFIRGAGLASEGGAIIALPSMARGASRGSSPRCRRAPAWSRPGRTSGPS
jgi:hypothetical protein